MLLGNDVFNVVGEFAVLLVEQAVFATVACPTAKSSRVCGVHCYLLFESRCWRALSLRIEMKSAALISASYSARSSSVSSCPHVTTIGEASSDGRNLLAVRPTAVPGSSSRDRVSGGADGTVRHATLIPVLLAAVSGRASDAGDV